MKTIGAKQLRQNLTEILDRVAGGEEIIVQHRFKPPIRLSAAHYSDQPQVAPLAGLQAFDAADKQPSPYDPRKSLKQLYHETLRRQLSKD